jgi:uncharacterized protein (TIGR02217 family)
MASLTVYSDIVMSTRLMQAGLRGKLMRRNSRVMTQDGSQRANIVWDATLRQWDFGFVPMTHAQWMEFVGLYENTDGGAFGFLMRDPQDSHVAVTEGVVTAITSTTFQLWKKYTEPVSSRTKTRKITRPVSTGLLVYVSGVSTAYTLDADTGIVTIGSAPSAANVTWAGDFYVPVHFQDDDIDWEAVGQGQSEEARWTAGQSIVLQEVRE